MWPAVVGTLLAFSEVGEKECSFPCTFSTTLTEEGRGGQESSGGVQSLFLGLETVGAVDSRVLKDCWTEHMAPSEPVNHKSTWSKSKGLKGSELMVWFLT